MRPEKTGTKFHLWHSRVWKVLGYTTISFTTKQIGIVSSCGVSSGTLYVWNLCLNNYLNHSALIKT